MYHKDSELLRTRVSKRDEQCFTRIAVPDRAIDAPLHRQRPQPTQTTAAVYILGLSISLLHVKVPQRPSGTRFSHDGALQTRYLIGG